MYAWIWRRLPGPLPARLLVCLVLVAAVLALLFLVAFPALDELLGFNEVTVQ